VLRPHADDDASMKYTEEARFRDFYKVGDDLIILAKRL
jgi:hypothetical protein